MAQERVEIIYEAMVRGADQVKDLSNKTKDLEQANEKASGAAEKAASAHDKQKSAMLKARDAIVSLRKELFALTVAVGIIKGLSASSDELAERFEKLGRVTAQALQPIGNFIARMFGGKGELSDTKKIELLQLQDDIARLRGDGAESLRKKLEAEEIKFNNSIRSLSDEKKKIFREEFEERKRLLIETQRLEELGLKRQQQIMNDFKKDLVSGFRGATGNTLFNLFEGTPQGGQEILASFRTAISRALADALSQSAFTAVLGGGGMSGFFENFKNILTGKNSTTSAVLQVNNAVDDMHRTLKNATDCICRTAENTAAVANSIGRGSPAIEGTITPAKTSSLIKIGSISNLVGAVAGASAFSGANLGSGGLPSNAGITMNGGPLMHSGGYVRAFSSGGEVPMTAQGGEFVVRKSVAMANKDFLTDFNLHGDTKRTKNSSGGNVFLIKANDAASFSDQLASPSGRAQIEMQVVRAIMGNGTLRKIMKEYTK